MQIYYFVISSCLGLYCGLSGERKPYKLEGHNNMLQTPLKAFISYKWKDDAHNQWVQRFATDLRRAGIDAKLDRWEVRFGESFIDYMTSQINQADIFLFIMTTASVAAVENTEEGYVKFEVQMATARQKEGEKLRMIGIYREGSKTPAHLRGRLYADFRDDARYEENLKKLVDDLLDKIQAPPVKIPPNP
ncbi:toll/interleukin-1 receptor domain-containing protein [Candidatus Poribacteria bacterium]|nr:toll/interleukin-1 receptor domain-containing protein [Candidatus Poribacteria bacterium]